MVDKGHDVKLYCRNESIEKFNNAFEKADLILIMRGEEKFEFTK